MKVFENMQKGSRNYWEEKLHNLKVRTKSQDVRPVTVVEGKAILEVPSSTSDSPTERSCLFLK